MSEKQILTMLARMLEHWELFDQLPTEIRRQVIRNPKEMVPLICELLKERLQPPLPEPPLFNFFGIKSVPLPSMNSNSGAPGTELSKWLAEASDVLFLCSYGLLRDANDAEIISVLGGQRMVRTIRPLIGALVEFQKNGKVGLLDVDGKANVFYVADSSGGTPNVVHFSWVGKDWRFGTKRIALQDGAMRLNALLDDSHSWGRGDRIIVPLGCPACFRSHVMGDTFESKMLGYVL